MRFVGLLVISLFSVSCFAQMDRYNPALKCQAIHETIEKIILKQVNKRHNKFQCKLALSAASTNIIGAKNAFINKNNKNARSFLYNTLNSLFTAYKHNCDEHLKIWVEFDKTLEVYTDFFGDN